ncbi:MAG: ATP-dependent DNA helicase [Acidimicrobiia bacterium]|nr:ATP-dependent DNA helicase [Acidimicrobiia bacterium]
MTFTPTAEQRAIIEYPLLPLRVIAGAGTGKTTTIVHRLAHLVDAGLSPERAIGITFTNKAAEELAGRLREALPGLAENGREVEVTTYHGFAYGILQEFGAIVGVERDTEVVGPGYVRQLLHEAIAAGQYDTLDLTWIPARVDEAVDLSAQLARNLRTAADIAPGEDEIAATRSEIAAIVQRYDEAKRELGVLDYGDLILLTHKLLTSHPQIAERVRTRYSVALLDEYQDTDPAQRELLRAVFGGGFPVTAVGDADQTIYEWRGASTTNFDNFPVHFPTPDGTAAETLPLTENRRSGSLILEAAHGVRSVLYGDEAFSPLRPVDTAPPGVIGLDYFRTAVDEAEWIAEEILRLNTEEGVKWRDTAVIFRKNGDMALVRDALQALDVPVEVGSLGGLLELPDVADLHAWLRTIERPGDSIALARLLLGPTYRLGLRDIATLSNWIKPQRAMLGDDPDLGWPLVEAIDQLEEIDDIRPVARKRLLAFRQLYRRFLELAQGSSLVDLCRHVLDETGMWNEVEAREAGAALTARVNLYRFLDLAEEWSPLRGRPTLQAFLSYLDLIADDKSAAELDTANVGTEDAVVLLTVHRAKGLEWDTVFLPTLTDGVFPVGRGAFDDPDRLARFVPYELRLEAPVPIELEGEDRIDALRAVRNRQEWRTAYVGITRAKTRLYLTGAHWHGRATKPRPPSPVMEAAATAADLVINHRVDNPGEQPETMSIVSAEGAPDPLFPAGWRAALQATLDDPGWPRELVPGGAESYDAAVDQMHMILDDLPSPPGETAEEAGVDTSVTGLVTLAECPQRFFWSEVEPLPRRQAPAMRRGVKVHRLIELHGRGEMPLDELADDLYDVTAGDEPTPGGPDPYQVYLDSRFAHSKPRYVEAPIDIGLGSGRIRGRVDAVYESEPGSWEIVDFKSGRNGANPAAIVQLEAYAVAAADGALSSETPDAIAVTFAYLGGGNLEEVTIAVDHEWLTTARAHLESLLDSASGPDYPQSPSPACRQCDFLRFCDAGRTYVSADADH